jgi:hypothetical protein
MARLKPEHLEELRKLHAQTVALLDGLAQVDPAFAATASRMKGVMDGALTMQNLRGTREAARDIRGLLDAVSPKQRQAVLTRVKAVTGVPLEGEYEKDKAAADRILARGKIRNEREYYLLRAYLEHLEGGIANEEHQSAVARLIGSYGA